MTDPTHYPVYPHKTLGCALLIIGLCLVNCASMASYAEGYTKTTTDMTLEARHIIVGKVVYVSFVFDQGYGPQSLVTVRVDKDIKQEIERADNQQTNPPQRQVSEKDRKTPAQLVTFVQIGGPYRLFDFLPFPSGDWVTAVGVNNVKRGDRVFLKLLPTTSPVEHNGKTADSYPQDRGSIYSARGKGGEFDEHIIERGWLGMDVTVLQMTRIVRATLKQPERMRILARRVSKLKRRPFVQDAQGRYRPKQPDDRLPIVMDEVRVIETELNLPPLCGSDRVKDD